MTVRFHVLGQIEVTVHGDVVDLGLRQRDSLALLLLRANRTVTVDQLVEVSFADPVPESAWRQVRNTVGRLRRTLAAAGCPSVIRTRPGGYLLEAGPETLDLLEYAGHVEAGRRAAAEGRHAQAVTSLRAGLALWRGPLLSGIDATVLEAEKTGMEEARLAVLEECLELELRLGRHRELLSELATLTGEHPMRERMWELRMLALYRCGAKADALALYQAARRTFLEELGLEPEPRLARLEQAILTGDPSLDLDREPDRPRPGQLPPDVPGLHRAGSGGGRVGGGAAAGGRARGGRPDRHRQGRGGQDHTGLAHRAPRAGAVSGRPAVRPAACRTGSAGGARGGSRAVPARAG